MIWYNGYIQIKEKVKPLFDDNGNPIVVNQDIWSDYIPCGYDENLNLLSKSTEKSAIKAQTINIRIKLQKNITERIKLYDSDKNNVGEFVVQSYNHYKYIDETHIVCMR